eukprot:76442-Rhodomonas_salina.1
MVAAGIAPDKVSYNILIAALAREVSPSTPQIKTQQKEQKGHAFLVQIYRDLRWLAVISLWMLLAVYVASLALRSMCRGSMLMCLS